MRIGICGTGAFADKFIPLFKAHPDVERVVLCDLDSEKLRQKAVQFSIADTSPSLEALCRTDVDAIAIITQPERHGPQAVQALRAGKHVYSAVPSAWSLDEISLLVDGAAPDAAVSAAPVSSASGVFISFLASGAIGPRDG